MFRLQKEKRETIEITYFKESDGGDVSTCKRYIMIPTNTSSYAVSAMLKGLDDFFYSKLDPEYSLFSKDYDDNLSLWENKTKSLLSTNTDEIHKRLFWEDY